MKSFKKIKKLEWQELASRWKRLQPPWKPSSERIKIYRELLNKYAPGRKTLVLGATPEIRDLLARMKFEVTILDFSPIMVKAMTSLRRIRSKERVVIGDWSTTDISSKYDLIIGDSAVCNLLPQQYHAFFQRVNKFLKNDGILICQNPVLSKSLKKIKISPQEIIDKAKRKPNSYKNYLNKAYDYLRWSFSHTRKHLVNFGELNEIYRQKLKQGEITKKEFNLLDFGLPKEFLLSFFNEKELKKILQCHWRIIKEIYEREHYVYKDFYRIYLLKKKQYAQ